MPIPTPNKDEKKEDYIERFMSNEKMIREYPEREKRFAIAQTEWNRTKEKRDV